MADRASDSSYDGKVEEASVAMKMDAKSMNQLSSSGKAAQQKRSGKAIASLQAAAEQLKRDENNSQGQSQNQPR
ncbi:hypothetical protein N7471_010478 [Penicillium samsonianum]|uniref:uncharacterized protein n=1 Tax=Penicillium samsonianum TaxID=1882272 RepID=UPI00254980C6|nr:uncharacterized protein N7471_010478 [Penicillium samsonianum]KAJ6125985.1 hypothetical protein N7471_010478 [Penicillium samsonianum]